jgi:hypothetical protein
VYFTVYTEQSEKALLLHLPIAFRPKPRGTNAKKEEVLRPGIGDPLPDAPGYTYRVAGANINYLLPNFRAAAARLDVVNFSRFYGVPAGRHPRFYAGAGDGDILVVRAVNDLDDVATFSGVKFGCGLGWVIHNF